MANISASLVKELRERTGAGMMDCKRALADAGGDLEGAIEALRAKGLAAAAKKGGRIAADGLIGLETAAGEGALVEINAETDFVARNEAFQALVRTLGQLALSLKGDVAAMQAATYPGTARTVAEEITQQIATLGEKIDLRRAEHLAVSPGIVAGYVHAALVPGLGRIGVLVGLRSDGDPVALTAFGHQLAMHVAAADPLAVAIEDLDPAVMDKERRILGEQARQSGKPENIIDKMVEGRLRKFYEESVLLQQAFVIDDDQTVAEAVAECAAELGAPVEIGGFVRFNRGEGIERKDDDFAAEVAAQAGG